MKIRNGFVSNSSSSSFIIDKTKLKPLQILAIRDHIYTAKNIGMGEVCEEDAWYVDETETNFNLETVINNFDMSEFLEKIDALHAVISHDHS